MKRESTPLLTVVSLTYNTGSHILSSLESIKSQTFKDFHHIIIDDASTDNTPAIVRKWIEDHSYLCTFIVNEKNLGICKCLNKAIGLTTTPFFYAVGDDVLVSNKLEKDIAILMKDPTLDFCYSKMIVHNLETGEKTPAEIKGSDKLFEDYFTAKASIPAPTVVYRMESLRKAGYYDESIRFEDLDMNLRILYKGKAHFRNDFTVEYIRTSNSLSSSAIHKSLVRESFRFLKKKWQNELPNCNRLIRRRYFFYLKHFIGEKDFEEAKYYAKKSWIFCFHPRFILSLFRILRKSSPISLCLSLIFTFQPWMDCARLPVPSYLFPI